MSEKKPNKDPLHPLKYIGYCRVFGNADGYASLLKGAKFYLCKKTRTLWKAKIWESYLDEDILVEYFAYIFSENTEFRTEFEALLGLDASEDIYKWLDDMILENQETVKKQEDALEDSITLNTLDLGN